MQQFFEGLKMVRTSFAFIREHRMRYVYIVVVVLGVLFFILSKWLSGTMQDWVQGLVDALVSGSFMPQWLEQFIATAAGVVTWIAVFVAMGLLGGYVLLLVLSPIFSLMAERTISVLDTKPDNSGIKAFVWSIVRGIGVSMLSFVKQTVLLLLIFVLGFVPVVGWVAPLLTLAVNAYYFGVSMADYSMEARRMTVGRSMQLAASMRAGMIGVGMPFTVALFIPVIGKYIALLIAPATVVAAARMVVGNTLPEKHN